MLWIVVAEVAARRIDVACRCTKDFGGVGFLGRPNRVDDAKSVDIENGFGSEGKPCRIDLQMFMRLLESLTKTESGGDVRAEHLTQLSRLPSGLYRSRKRSSDEDTDAVGIGCEDREEVRVAESLDETRRNVRVVPGGFEPGSCEPRERDRVENFGRDDGPRGFEPR